MKRQEEAIKIFQSGYNCCQAVIGVFCKDFGLDKATAYKMATGFGGGIRKGEVCGAVSGAVMALGLREGFHMVGDKDTKSKAYSLTTEFMDRYLEKSGAVTCHKLLGYDPAHEKEWKVKKEKGEFQHICCKAITDAVEVLEELLALEKED